ncbi:MAG TPA: hypothetical protein VN750_00745 [Steroidobacteraceae bacterium]|nr:hypothetical protein [Steroidobacteraceae bacterium]
MRAPQPRAGEPARLTFFLVAAAVISVTCAAPAVAQNEPPPAQHDKYSGAPLPPTTEHIVPSPITDRFALRGTFFDSAVTTSLRVDSDRTGQGTLVNAERDLGLRGRVYQGRVEMYIRMRERHRLRVDYFESDRSGNKALTIPINFADQSFRKGDVAHTELDLRMFGLTYTYSMLRYERFELGGGLGVYLVQGDARGQVPARELSQEVSGVAPVPTLALDGTVRISRRFAFVARGQYMNGSSDNFNGSLADYHADFQYRWRPNFAIGVGYSQMRLSLEVRGGSFPGLVSLDVRGPELFFRVSY